MKLEEVAATPIGKTSKPFLFDSLFKALEEDAYEVNYSDWEWDEGDQVATGHFSDVNGGGDIRFTITPRGLKVEVRGEDNSGEEHENMFVIPVKDRTPKEIASDIDEEMGNFTHNFAEDDTMIDDDGAEQEGDDK